MTSIEGGFESTAPRTDQVGWGLALLVPLLLVLGAVLTASRIASLWQTGVFGDPDDAMRLSQVRALLAGQGWFDMTAYRLDPPQGVFMHWSRIVDIPLAVLIGAGRLFLAPDMAERAARLAFPLALQAAFYVGVAGLGRRLVGPAAVLPSLFIAFLSGIVFDQFAPGRIDHHAPQIVLLVFMTGAFVDALDPRLARRAASAATLAAVSLAISLENVPFILTLTAAIVLAWAWHGEPLRGVMVWFAAASSAVLLIVYGATVSPAHWLLTVSDALSAGQLLIGLLAAASCGLFGAVSARLTTAPARVAAATSAGAVILGVAALLCPAALRQPFADVDPLLREIWLSNVHEALPLPRLLAEQPRDALSLALPIFLGLAAILAAVLCERDASRERWLVLAAAVAAGAGMAFWQVRVFSSVSPLALLGGVWLMTRLGAALARTRPALAAGAFLVLLPFGWLGWVLVIPQAAAKPAAAVDAGCFASASYAPLRTLPHGLVAAPIDAGAHLLTLTDHSALAAPYHRDNDGNRAVVDAFLAPPEVAEALLRARHAAYLMICDGFNELTILRRRAPDGLAARLLDGQVPAWLQPLPLQGTPLKIFSLASP